jgi:hypothetical protein
VLVALIPIRKWYSPALQGELMSPVIRRSLWGGLGVSLVVVFVAAGSPDAQVKPSADSPKPKAIPLDTAYNWNEQQGLKTVHGVDYDTDKLYKSFLENGLSNIYLVRGRDIKEALAATLYAMKGGTGVENGVRVHHDDKNPAKALWLVAYLGKGQSTPLLFEFTGVERDGNRFRVGYRYTRPGGGSDDLKPYPLWGSPALLVGTRRIR